MQEEQRKWMERAIFLARLGLGKTKSNPLVGAVLVKDNQILGEGYHHQFGGAHAEVEALKNLSKEECEDACLYVTLEPCSHFGKTPPCTDLILEKGIKKVIISNKDPHPLVSGKGIEKLRNSGVEVIVGFSESECKEMNIRFFTKLDKKRPYILLKWAQSMNGIMGIGKINDPTKGKISNSLTLPYTHRWRAEEQAILVGCNTILNDNPLLSVRAWTGDNPLVIIIDPNGRIDTEKHKIFHEKSAKEVIILSIKDRVPKPSQFHLLFDKNEFELSNLLGHLAEKEINSVMVEGGSKTLQQFIDSGNWDEIRYFQSNDFLKGEIKAPTIKNAILQKKISIGNNFLSILKPQA
jgi:diaminohydroxyphosphoribosylaminopyrimidine deaminase / 5-amino-6-(5-phosphoribosylamino)uracil reductase